MLRKNIFTKTLRQILERLTQGQKKKVVIISITIILNVLIDLIGLSAVLPVLYIVGNPEIIETNQYLHSLYSFFGFTNIDNYLIFIAILLFFIFLIKNIAGVFLSYVQFKLINKIALELTNIQLKTYTQKGYSYFKDKHSNYIMRDIAAIPAEFAANIITPYLSLITETLIIVLISVTISIYNIYLFIFLFISLIPAFYFFNLKSKKKISKLGIERNDIRPNSYRTIFDIIHGYTDVKLSGKISYFINRSNKLMINFYKIVTKVKTYEIIPIRLIELFAILGLVVLFVFYLKLSPDQKETMGTTLIIFATAAYRVMPSLSRIMNSMIKIKNYSYVFDHLEPNPSDIPLTVTISKLPFEKEVVIQNVSFEYKEGKAVLNNINLSLEKGKIVGVVGESGSGKSTLLKIVSRLLHQKSGKIIIDQEEINSSNEDLWVNNIGYVQQDFFMISGTLSENIAFGIDKNNIDKEKVIDCLQKVELGDFLNDLEHGIETNIGEFGSNISGGQKQRIAIARSLYKKADILLLDEATSSLDEKTEIEIMKTIRELAQQNLTVLIITHRTKPLEYCDKVYRMDAGTLSENI